MIVTEANAEARKVLRDAKVTADDVKGVVMVGGSTRMPQVRAAVADTFGREPRQVFRTAGGGKDPPAAGLHLPNRFQEGGIVHERLAPLEVDHFDAAQLLGLGRTARPHGDGGWGGQAEGTGAGDHEHGDDLLALMLRGPVFVPLFVVERRIA